MIAVHVSNRYLNLFPVVAGAAERHGMQMIYIQTYRDETAADAESDWLLLTKNKNFANDAFVLDHASDFEDEVTRPILWTDHYSNLLSVLR